MAIRNQIASIVYRALLALFGLGLYGASLYLRGVGQILSIDLLLTLFVDILLWIEVVVNAISLIRKGPHRLAAGLIPGLTFIALALSLSHIILTPIFNALLGEAYLQGDRTFFDNFGNGLLFPLLYFLDYLLFGEKGTVKMKDIFFVPVFPLIYGVTTLLAREIGGKEGRSWISAFEPNSYKASTEVTWLSGNNGWNGVVFAFFLAIFTHLLVATLLYFLGRLLARPEILPKTPTTK